MGREIVYCWKCAKRLDGGDFDRLKAYRYGDKVSCDECVFDLVGDLPAEEQEAILNGSASEPKPAAAPPRRSGGTTRTSAVPPRSGQTTKVGRGTDRIPKVDAGGGTKSIPRRGTRVLPKVEAPLAEAPAEEGVDPEAAAKKKKLILIGAGGGGLLLVVIVVLAILLMGGKKKPAAAPVDGEAAAKTDTRKPDPKSSKEDAAKKAYEAAMAVYRDKPGDLDAQMKALLEAELVATGTDTNENVQKQLEVLGLEVTKQLAALDTQLVPLTTSDKFKAALDLVDKAATTHNFPKWKDGVDAKLKYVKDKLEERYLQEKKAALEAKENDDKAKVAVVVEKIRSWELQDLIERLNKDLGAVAVAPDAPPPPPDSTAKTPGPKKPKREAKPLSKDMAAYQPSFERALGLAFQRDFDGAMTEIRRAAKEIDSDEAKKESGLDLDLLEKAKTWVEASVKAMASTKRLENLSLEYFDRPAEVKVLSGRVTKVFEQRLEFKATVEKDGKKTTTSLFVEYADLSGRSLAEQMKKIQGKVDARLAGLVCLIEGNEEAAQALGGREAEALPDRYWQYAPNAKERCPKSNGKEFEARNLFHAAENEFGDIKTWGPAFEKYKLLTNDYSTTRIVQRNQAAIVKRGQMGKEYVFNARNFNSEGAFKPARKPDLVLQGTKDIDTQEMKDNWVEAEFFALPNSTYRAWALIGGCCKETFGAYLQTSDRTTANAGKQVAIDPGANMAEQLKMQASGLKNDHAAHAPKDKKAPHPKDATRWEWVPIPLAKTYTEAGPKGIRLMTDQAGFAVKFIIVSSTRTKTPDAKETEEWVRQLAEEPAQDDSGVKGTPEPKEWLMAGPFDESLNKVNPPERDIDLAKELTGKGNKKFKWKVGPATLQSGYAVFAWEDGKTFNPKDNVSVYVLIHVKAPAPMQAQVSVGFDDGCKIWVNGEQALSNDRGGGVKNDEFKGKATLEEGWNRILVKVRNGNGGFGLSFRILDDKGQPAAGLEYSPYGDQLLPP